MRSYRKVTVLLGAALVVAALPSLAGARGPSSGSWTFTDITPNPTVFGECMNAGVPSAPTDVNSYPLKVTKKVSVLTILSHNTLDWAGQVTDSKGNVIASVDGGLPTDVENMTVPLRKGSYTVSYCNWAGEPTITVDWSLK